jgi:hypothetical protein
MYETKFPHAAHSDHEDDTTLGTGGLGSTLVPGEGVPAPKSAPELEGADEEADPRALKAAAAQGSQLLEQRLHSMANGIRRALTEPLDRPYGVG